MPSRTTITPSQMNTDDYYPIFESFVQKLKMYIETHGHMNVSVQDKELYDWIRIIRQEHYKGILLGKPFCTMLTPYRVKLLNEIGFEFEYEYKTQDLVPFESHIEALKLYQTKHGHMCVSSRENQSLGIFVATVKKSAKMVKEGREPPIKLTPDRMKILQEIDFEFRSTKSNFWVPFRSHIEALKLYQEKHGHMFVSKEEDHALYNFIGDVRRVVKMMEKGRACNFYFKISPDRMKILQEIGFPFKAQPSFEAYVEALKFYQAKHGHLDVTEKEDKSLNTFISHVRQTAKKIQEGSHPRLVKLTPDRIITLGEMGFDFRCDTDRTPISGNPSTSCNRSVKREIVEEKLHVKHEEIPTTTKPFSTTANEYDNVEEIDGGVIPSWLINDDEEEDNCDRLLDEMSIKIDGETEILESGIEVEVYNHVSKRVKREK